MLKDHKAAVSIVQCHRITVRAQKSSEKTCINHFLSRIATEKAEAIFGDDLRKLLCNHKI